MKLHYQYLTWRPVRRMGETYKAERGLWTFALDKVAGEWRLRGWKAGASVILRHGRTARELQLLADDDCLT